MRLRPSAVVLSITAAWTLACASDRETLNNWLSAPADGWVGSTFTVRESINYSGHADDPELVAWISARLPLAHALFLVHGEEPAVEDETHQQGQHAHAEADQQPIVHG